MKNPLNYLVVLSVALLVTACSDSGSNSNDNSNNPAANASASAAVYSGSWGSGCVASVFENTQGKFIDYSIRFDATEWVYVQAVYVDESCSAQQEGTADAGSVTGTTTISGTYTDLGTGMTAEGLMAHILPSTITDFSNTLEGATVDPNSFIGSMVELAVYVNDADTLFMDGSLVAGADESGSVFLEIPFYKR